MTSGSPPLDSSAAAAAGAEPLAPAAAPVAVADSASVRPVAAHLDGLDGLRAIAVLSVMLYHLNLSSFFPGGFLGVDIFFTLSGFLITSLLLREYDASGGIAVGAFYVRRFRRLAPAMLAVIACCALLLPLVAVEAIGQLRQDIPAALLYVSNWWQIASAQSYFEMMNRPPLLQHLWSLAIEEQFYLAWPALLLLVLRRAGRRGLLWTALGLTGLTAGWMALLAVQGNIPLEADPNRLYLGTDTHTTGLFAGALLACLWNPWAVTAGVATAAATPAQRPRPVWVLEAAGALGLAGLLLLFAYANETQDWLYRGGFLLVALLTIAVIVAATQPGTGIARLLGTRVMRYMGARSYGLYLWHWPVFVLLRPQDLTLAPMATEGLRLLLTFLVAEASFRYVEDPLRHGRLADWSRGRRIALGAAVTVGCLAVVALYLRPVPAPVAPPVAVAPTLPSPMVEDATAAPVPGATVVPGIEAFSGALAGPVDMLAIGDSVLLGARQYFLRGLPGAWVDAQVGRQGREAIRIVRRLREQEKLPATVLLHLGTNGYLPESLYRKLLVELADRERVVLVNVHASRRWAADNNALLASLSHLQPNIVLVDWATLSDGHPEYFVEDGIHLTAAGIKAYVGAIRQASGVTGAFLSAAQVRAAALPGADAKADVTPATVAKVDGAVASPALAPGVPPAGATDPALPDATAGVAASAPGGAGSAAEAQAGHNKMSAVPGTGTGAGTEAATEAPPARAPNETATSPLPGPAPALPAAVPMAPAPVTDGATP